MDHEPGSRSVRRNGGGGAGRKVSQRVTAILREHWINLPIAGAQGLRGRPDILVVEDEPAMADAMLRVLDIGGYAPRRAENGRQALRAAALHRPALVLLDILMPVMDGWQCARELRVRYGNSLPIVIVTAVEHAEAHAAELGADAVLTKPFEMRDFLDVVARHAASGRAAVN